MKKRINIIGGGASALLFACHINTELYDVHLYEQQKTLGRKLLVAGKGGFNLTHGEDISEMLTRYSTTFLHPSLLSFTNTDLTDWLERIGITTYIGTSNRIFPTKEIKPTDVLQKLVDIIEQKNIQVHYNHKWVGYKNGNVLIQNNATTTLIEGGFTIYALGGKSWTKTGSDGIWTSLLPSSINLIPFEASNCGYLVNWDNNFIESQEGKPLKNIGVSIADHYKKGELLITKRGLEGGSIYALSPHIRESLGTNKNTSIHVDLKPNFTKEKTNLLIENKRPNQSWKDFFIKTIKLDKTQYALLLAYTDKDMYKSNKLIVNSIKQLPIPIIGSNPIDEAISTVGGIDCNEVTTSFELKKLSNHFVIGEMIDWDAHTGGYLLQACFSMGVYLARYFNHKNNDHESKN